MYPSKIIVAVALSITASSAMAAGVQCDAQCIVIEADDYRTYVLPPVSYAADLNAREAFSQLTKECASLAAAFGFRMPGVLVDRIAFRATRDSEVISEASGSTTHSGGFSSDASGTFWKGRGGRRAPRGGAYHSSVNAYSVASASWSEYHSSRDDRTLEINLEPASAASSCVPDPEIENGYIPYSGSLPVRG